MVVEDVDGIFTSDSDDRGQTDDSGDGGEEGADKGGRMDQSVSQVRESKDDPASDRRQPDSQTAR